MASATPCGATGRPRRLKRNCSECGRGHSTLWHGADPKLLCDACHAAGTDSMDVVESKEGDAVAADDLGTA